MKLKPVVIIISIFFFINVNLYSQKKTNDTITFNSVLVGNVDKNTIAYICNDFIVNAFSRGYKIKSLIKNYKKDFEVAKEPMPNLHNEKIIDTIFHFTNKKNKISVYKANKVEFVNEFDVSDKKFTLLGNIKTGMSKDDFKKKFRIKDIKEDNVVISDEYNMMKFSFAFKKNVLSKISYKAFID